MSDTYIQVEGSEVSNVRIVKSSKEICRYTIGNLIVVMMGTVRKGEDKEFWENDNYYNYYMTLMT